MFEVGVAYKRGPNVYIAIDTCVLMGPKWKRYRLVNPALRVLYRVLRNLSVRELAHIWGVQVADIDKRLAKYFAPPPRDPTRRSIRGERKGRKARQANDEYTPYRVILGYDVDD